MTHNYLRGLLALCLFSAPNALATVRYVDVNNTNAAPPYASWTTAATNIQDAVDAAAAGDQVLVTNGVYQTGGKAVFGTMTNRVAVDKPVAVQSVNGPQFTIIEGYQVFPFFPNGDGAVRCAYLTNGAMLAGFTLTNGATRINGDEDRELKGGGVWCESTSAVVSNCVLVGNSAYEYGGGSYGGTLTDCSLRGNSALFGGGAYFGVLNNCTLTENSVSGLFSGAGGAAFATLNNCTLSGNHANYGGPGGGAFESTLNNCMLTGNSAGSGGGASQSTLNNCTLAGNSASEGGGVYGSTLNNCALTGNSANSSGGGAAYATLNNCTLTGNSANVSGGGVDGGTLTNCIVYYNTAPTDANYAGGALNYCCTTPLPVSGSGNLNIEPQLASSFRLSANSPCLGGGTYAAISGVDIDGEPWANPPAMGCDQYYGGSITGALTVALLASYTNVVAGFSVDFQALISGRVSASRWEFGDATVASNRPSASHGWSATGDYPVILRAFNESYPAGVTATVTVHVVTATHYVAADSATPLAPYDSWATAATNIQDAVDAASVAGASVLVSNGVYASGGNTAGRVVADKPVTIQSVNGPQFTVISGDGTVRCVYLTNRTLLIGFTLTNGVAANESGGGLAFGGYHSDVVVSNCVIVGNSASIDGGGVGSVFLGGGSFPQGGTLNNCTLAGNSASSGGGAAWASLNNCTLTGNSAANEGGGTCFGTLNNCALIGNSAGSGGGAAFATLNNCTLTTNSAGYSGGGASGGTLNNCTLSGNSAGSLGGGAEGSTLNNCTLTGNSATNYGGGADGGVLNYCALTDNRVTYGTGGAASFATLNNCTVTGNSAYFGGGGIIQCVLTNCIVYYNTGLGLGDANYDNFSTLEYSCTTPLPTSGVGNLDVEPQLASSSHLSANSPCIGQGTYAAVNGVDIDGEPWASPPAIGCDEYHSGSVTGPLTVAPLASYTNVAVGFNVGFQALISGRGSASRWEFGDGTVVSNLPFASHAWSAAGDYPVVLRAYNESYPAGVSATTTVHVVTQPVHYVAVGNAAPALPYTSWATAATNIQDAVDAASVPGSLVLVSNGLYQTGGRAVGGSMTNRVAVDKLVRLRSVNGPAVTLIVGYQVPGTTNGEAAVRCVYLTNGAMLTGFTLTNGATQITGDEQKQQSGGGVWCEPGAGVVSNCVLTGNSAFYYGGGASGFGGTLNNCTLIGNSAQYGGGAVGSMLNNCTLSGNSANSGGGGAYGGTLNNCVLTDNSANSYGGGASSATLNNCTLTGNSAINYSGGGADSATLNNCIVYYNTAPTGGNYAYSTLNYCSTTPLPADGIGNRTDEPQLASASHLSAGSPCRGRGKAAYVTGVDTDGEPWANPPAIGCDEYWAGSATGALSAAILVSYTNVAVGFGLDFHAVIGGRVSASVWSFGDGVVVSNRPWASHSWLTAGDYLVQLRAYNESFPAGVTATVMVHVVTQPVHYVTVGNATPAAPYTSWATAATSIQAAVDAASVPGALVLVSNGVYQTGARAVYGMSNRVAVSKAMTVRSVNGPAVTRIVGHQMPGTMNGLAAVRCVYLANGALLAGFTLTNGATQTSGDAGRQQSGGGVWSESGGVVSNCVLTGNSAYYGGGAANGTLHYCTLTGNSANAGGGVSGSTLHYCTLTTNSASAGGGGASGGTLNNCTLTGNSAGPYGDGGGVSGGTLYNCTLTGNSGTYGGGAAYATLNNCMLTANSAVYNGGGVIVSTLNNCTLAGNWANDGGGGAYNSTLNNCTLRSNSVSWFGGGASRGTLNNCTLTGNSAANGGRGGTDDATLNNCILYYNTAPADANYAGGALNYCCTTPMPAFGLGNLTNAPLFVDQAGGNLRLQSNSPCINAGDNAVAPGSTDLDANARILAGTVDMGAYECPTPALLDYFLWAQSYGVSTSAAAISGDHDSDLMNNWQEWIAGTVPTDALSALQLLNPIRDTFGVTVTWQSVSNRIYFLERSTNLGATPPFVLLQSYISGQPGTTSFTDTNASGPGPFLYRVGVQ